MYRKVICLLIIVCVVLNGCSGFSSVKSFDGAIEKLQKLKSYTCDVEMSVTNNKSTMEYKLKHSYMSPDKYRIEVVEPKGFKGQVTIHNNEGTYIYHPSINEYLAAENFSESHEHQAFIGSFISYMKDKEKLKVDKEEAQDKFYYVIEFEVPKPNDYMNREKIWIDAGSIMPEKAEIYDKNGKITVSVRYANFVCNPELNERDFEIPIKKQ